MSVALLASLLIPATAAAHPSHHHARPARVHPVAHRSVAAGLAVR